MLTYNKRTKMFHSQPQSIVQCLQLVDFFDYLNNNMYKWKVKGIFKITVRNSTVNILWVKIYTIKTYYFIVAVSYSSKTIHRYSSRNKISMIIHLHSSRPNWRRTTLQVNHFEWTSKWNQEREWNINHHHQFWSCCS